MALFSPPARSCRDPSRSCKGVAKTALRRPIVFRPGHDAQCNKRRGNGLFVIAALAFLSACAAKGQVFSGPVAPETKKIAVVYIYRPNRFMLGGAAPDIYVDDERRFRLRNNGFNVVKLTPGTHTIEPRTSPAWDSAFSPKLIPTELSVEGGKVYFIKLNLDEAGLNTSNINAVGYTGYVQLSIVDAQTAQSELVGTKLSE